MRVICEHGRGILAHLVSVVKTLRTQRAVSSLKVTWSLYPPNFLKTMVVEKLIAAELCHQKWDPKKVIAWLRGRHPEEQWPAVSTAGEILRREGLVRALRPIYIQLVIQSVEPRRRLIRRLLLSGAWGYHGIDVVLTELMTKMKPSPL